MLKEQYREEEDHLSLYFCDNEYVWGAELLSHVHGYKGWHGMEFQNNLDVELWPKWWRLMEKTGFYKVDASNFFKIGRYLIFDN